jgi:hypothetical protein
MPAENPPGQTAGLPGPHAATPSGKPRARSIGIPFDGTPGPWNAITDVPGVEVGYATLIRGTSVRTGVTAIHPRGAAGDPVAAGFFSQNGNGEMTGVSWINESLQPPAGQAGRTPAAELQPPRGWLPPPQPAAFAGSIDVVGPLLLLF